ncbi:hypothetical protein [Pontibacter chitinilyticus]|uniref:hypothetical protein n=1 Tax=Pontibacter chitinilyticus TaxID=2674989 RepID=UPI00321BB66A
MENTPGITNGTGGENQRIGRELYNKDQEKQQTNQRYGYRGDQNREWDAGNYFHTGPSNRGAQDDRNYTRGGASNTSYNQGQNAHLDDHYGSTNSPYRNEQRFINHGNHDDYNNNYNRQGGFVSGERPGNYNDINNDTRNDVWRDGPGTRSRYKEDDYRYGSGSHNWYREGRYTPDQEHTSHDKRGFFERVKDGWNDIMHSDDPNYTSHDHTQHNRFDRERRGSEVFRDRHFDRGYENGPRWADRSDSGNDDRYNDTDRNQRYRR